MCPPKKGGVVQPLRPPLSYAPACIHRIDRQVQTEPNYKTGLSTEVCL